MAIQTDAPVLEVKELSKHYALKSSQALLKAVDHVSLSVREGETLGIVGESGSGKSTLAKLMLQLEKPTSGSVLLHGTDLSTVDRKEMRAVKRNIQAVFQDPYASLNPRMKAKDVVTEPLLVHERLSRKALEARALALLQEVGLDESHMHRYPHEFSGGQRQRLSIARAIALKPEVVICDEPVSALDVSIQAQILNLLKELQKTYRMSYLFIAHGLPAVKYISDRVAIMYAGQIMEIGSRETIFTQPRHPYTYTLLEAVPVSHPSQRKRRLPREAERVDMSHTTPACPFYGRCPNRQDVCASVRPELSEHEPGVWYACHHPNTIEKEITS
ncbi:ABC transporter ATP-binding protein [Aureibacillus halotolerans]|uniref:Oligopeptide transport system ATP-binding protein n=1 Tax=Aureibacillus halotolerans TaxID=1508390 RepID=A0A4R6TV82_9BACI|nr:ABC transporter ATP-binding protein [Aureibacillus halotolerans]TDQ37680.1 oligopeptide transport system ATP-binding protein [Aureibacillus halotolerans]